MKEIRPMTESTNRLTSIDFFRGFTMFLLINEGFLSYFAGSEFQGTFVHNLFKQFTHPEWEGFRFWDLIHPFFQFTVGLVIPFSMTKRLAKGQSQKRLMRHAMQRSLILIFLGVTLFMGQTGGAISFENVLVQIGVAYFIAFMLTNKKPLWQILISVGLIVSTELLFRIFPVEGFNHPFEKFHNFSTWINQFIAPGAHDDWGSINAIPSAAWTIWGVLCGRLLLSGKTNLQKLKILILAGMIGLIMGYSLSTVTPVIKRITTSSYIFIGGGWSVLAFTLCYWIIDVKNRRRWAFFGVVVGMNPIFIYLFYGTIKNIAFIFAGPWISIIFEWTSQNLIEIVILAVSGFFNWYVCYFLYKKRIFFKL
jgi:predicted acyltransferase